MIDKDSKKCNNEYTKDFPQKESKTIFFFSQTMYLRKEYKYINGKATFFGWACGINGTSSHAIFKTKKEAKIYIAQAMKNA